MQKYTKVLTLTLIICFQLILDLIKSQSGGKFLTLILINYEVFGDKNETNPVHSLINKHKSK